jgi:cation transport ATPase
LSVVHRNLAISLAYNLAGATLAMVGLINPLVAAILMPVSSLSVVLSSMLVRHFGTPKHTSRVTASIEGAQVPAWR